MSQNRPIEDLFTPGKTLLSVEFFPPKNDEGAEQIVATAQALRAEVQPDFVSITYGAGGSTRERTLRYAGILKNEYGFQVMPHLTAVGSSKAELLEIVRQWERDGFRTIMALRGDPPKGETEFKPHPEGCRYGSDLVALLQEEVPSFCLGVGGYPEKHPEAATMHADMQALKTKVDAGASFITTQLFFDNASYFRFEKACRQMGINVPIVAGIMPVVSLKQIQRFCGMCGAQLPDELVARLEAVQGDPEAERQVGVDWAFAQLAELLARGVPGVHFYVLNRKKSVTELVQRLQQEGLLEGRRRTAVTA